MDEKTKEQLFRRALAAHAVKEMPSSRDVWPAIYQRVQRRNRGVTLNLTAAAPPMRWNFVAFATVALLFIGILSFALPATLGNYMPDHSILSPTRTYAATYSATYAATAIVLTSTPLPNATRHTSRADQPPLAAAQLASQPVDVASLPTPQPPVASR